MSIKWGSADFYKRSNWHIAEVVEAEEQTAFDSGAGYTETTEDNRRMWTMDGVYHREIVRKDGTPNRPYGSKR